MPRAKQHVTQAGTEISHQFPSNEDAPGEARALTRALLARTPGISEQCAGDLELAVSELVSNAVKHGPARPVDFRLIANGTTIRVEVVDAGTRPFAPPTETNGHWGLWLTQQFSDRFGIDHHPSTRVWCEFDIAQA